MNDAQRKIEPKVRVWPFVESPGELAARLHRALDDFDGDMIAAVRCVFIEEPALLAQSTPPQPCPWWSPLPCKALDECVSKGFCARDAAPDSAAPRLAERCGRCGGSLNGLEMDTGLCECQGDD
jgi:hypothetical protein